MRTHLLRGVFTFVALVTLLVAPAPALAQSQVRGKVVDSAGKPVDGATVTFEAEGTNRKATTKTNNKGEFIQVGLQSGTWKATASKDGVGTHTLPAAVSQGRPVELAFKLGAGGAATDAAAAEIQAAATAALEALRGGRSDEAIEKFNAVILKVPNCGECYTGLGQAYAGKKQFAEAETAFKKAVELKPDSGEAYTGLANIYNAQGKSDLAMEASTNAAKYVTGGGGAEASYNQGVILFNSQKFAEAKVQFEAATKADPTYGPAFYQLGMTNLNTGDFAGAAAALETYLKVDPNGAKAAEVKASLPALQAMAKK